MTECPRCHAPLPQPPERFCPTCGADLATAAPPPIAPPPVAPPPVAVAAPPPPASGGGAYGAGGGYGGGYGGGGYGGPGGRPPGGSTPWERRDQIGLLSALVETTKQVLTQPTDFFRGMPIVGGIQGPLLYGLIIGYLGLVASTIYQTIFRTIIGSSLSRMGGGGEFDKIMPMLQGGGFGLVINLIFGPVLIVIGLFIIAGIVHLALLLLQAGEKGFEPTFRVAAYAEGAAIINVVPFCGGLIAGVYTLVLLIIGISEAHGISRGKAAAAVLLPVVLFCCCCGIIPLMIAFGGLAGALGHAR